MAQARPRQLPSLPKSYKFKDTALPCFNPSEPSYSFPIRRFFILKPSWWTGVEKHVEKCGKQVERAVVKKNQPYLEIGRKTLYKAILLNIQIKPKCVIKWFSMVISTVIDGSIQRKLLTLHVINTMLISIINN